MAVEEEGTEDVVAAEGATVVVEVEDEDEAIPTTIISNTTDLLVAQEGIR